MSKIHRKGYLTTQLSRITYLNAAYIVFPKILFESTESRLKKSELATGSVNSSRLTELPLTSLVGNRETVEIKCVFCLSCAASPKSSGDRMTNSET